MAPLLSAACLLLCCAVVTANPILGVPTHSLHDEDAVSAASEGQEFAHLVVTTGETIAAVA